MLTLVQSFDPADDARAARGRDSLLELLRSHARPFARDSFDPGHVTASGLVLSPGAKATLLVLHERLGRWLQPGGHVEPGDPDIAAAARREVIEETGIRPDIAIPPLLVGLDVHEIPAARGEPPHLHHDLVFRFVASQDAPTASPEVVRAAWFPLDRLDEAGADDALRRAAERARRTLEPPRPRRSGT